MVGTPLDPENVSGTLGAVTEGGKRFRISVVLDLVLVSYISPQNPSLAFLGTLWCAAEGVIIAFNEVNNVVLLAVAQKSVSATGAEAVALEMMGRTLIVAEDWCLKIRVAFFALGWLMTGILSVSSGGVPSVLGWWAVAASLLAVVGRRLALVSPDSLGPLDQHRDRQFDRTLLAWIGGFSRCLVCPRSRGHVTEGSITRPILHLRAPVFRRCWKRVVPIISSNAIS